MTLGKGTHKELRLAVRAIRAARTHLKNARCGIHGAEDEAVRVVLVSLYWRQAELLRLLAKKSTKRGGA